MIVDELNKEDKRRINNCDFYKKAVEVMDACEKYKDLKLGEAYFIKFKRSHDDNYRYVTKSHGGKPSKFVVFHKDEKGFIFLKRVNATGKLGIEVVCLTTQYSSPVFIVEPDPEYIDAIILDTEKDYDPLKFEKELKKKKGQIRRKNKKLEIRYNTAAEASKALSKYKVGDKIWDAKTTYGDGIAEWRVESIINRPVDQSTPRSNGWNLQKYKGNTHQDRLHNEHALKTFIEVTLKCDLKPDSRRWIGTVRTIVFKNFMLRGNAYYDVRPLSTDDA